MSLLLRHPALVPCSARCSISGCATSSRVSCLLQTAPLTPLLQQYQRRSALSAFPQKTGLLSGRGTCRHLQVSCAIKKGSEKNVVCSKTLIGKPGQEKRVRQRCKDIVDFSKGRMSVRTSGVLAFECVQDRFDTNVFHFWERYDSNVAMGRHNNTAEMQAFMKEVCDRHCAARTAPCLPCHVSPLIC